MSQTQAITVPVQETQPNAVKTELQYYLDPEDGSNHVYIGTASVWRHKMDHQIMPIHDMRGSEQSFTLDQHGFEVHKHKSIEKTFTDVDVVKTTYYAEAAELLKQL